jgi:hypothetical protein
LYSTTEVGEPSLVPWAPYSEVRWRPSENRGFGRGYMFPIGRIVKRGIPDRVRKRPWLWYQDGWSVLKSEEGTGQILPVENTSSFTQKASRAVFRGKSPVLGNAQSPCQLVSL